MSQISDTIKFLRPNHHHAMIREDHPLTKLGPVHLIKVFGFEWGWRLDQQAPLEYHQRLFHFTCSVIVVKWYRSYLFNHQFR